LIQGNNQSSASSIPSGFNDQKFSDENIIDLSKMPGFLLEFQACLEVHIQKSSDTAAWTNNRIGNAPICLAEKTGGYECGNTSDK
jgi:hypothetical protein